MSMLFGLVFALSAIGCSGEQHTQWFKEDAMQPTTKSVDAGAVKPPIDLAQPQEFQTATFALG